MPRVLVTGGSGFVGHWMKQTQPAHTTAFYFNREQYAGAWWETLGIYDYVVHLAPVEPARAINCARRNNARLLYCSSGIVYHPESDKTEYRQNKIKWERECLESGVDCVIARLFTFCGEGLSRDHAIARFEWNAKNNLPLHIWGDGSCVRSYMHGEELGRWLWAILLRGQSGEAYDVGSDEPVTMLDLAYRIAERCDPMPPVIVDKDKIVPMPVYLPVDTGKTRKLLT